MSMIVAEVMMPKVMVSYVVASKVTMAEVAVLRVMISAEICIMTACTPVVMATIRRMREAH